VIQVSPSAFRRVEGQSCRGLECDKTILRLMKRGLLKAVPGIRHKRPTQQELKRFLGVQTMDGGAA